MSTDYIEAAVCPAIPTKCLADVEAWLLTRVFKAEPRGDDLSFHACWTWNDIYEERLSPDDELSKALAASSEICPDLCAAVKREFNKSSEIILGAVDYEIIFQSLIRRNPDFLRHISVVERDCNTKSFDYDETFTLIAADAIELIRTKRLYENNAFKRVGIVRRSGPLKSESSFILFSKRIFESKAAHPASTTEGLEMKRRISGQEATRVAEDMAKSAPVRLIASAKKHKAT